MHVCARGAPLLHPASCQRAAAYSLPCAVCGAPRCAARVCCAVGVYCCGMSLQGSILKKAGTASGLTAPNSAPPRLATGASKQQLRAQQQQRGQHQQAAAAAGAAGAGQGQQNGAPARVTPKSVPRARAAAFF